MKTVKNYHGPKFEFFSTPRSSIWAKNRIYGYGAKSRLGPLGSILGPIGSHWGKNGSKPKKITMPQDSYFWLLRGHRFGQKIEFTVMAPYHGRDPLGSILGPMGNHWGQKMGQNRTKLPCPKIRTFDYSAVIDLGKKSNLRLWHQITVGSPWGPSWGQWDTIGAKKWVKTVKKLPCPKIRIFDYSAVIDLGKISNLRLWRQITVGTP